MDESEADDRDSTMGDKWSVFIDILEARKKHMPPSSVESGCVIVLIDM